MQHYYILEIYEEELAKLDPNKVKIIKSWLENDNKDHWYLIAIDIKDYDSNPIPAILVAEL